MMSKLVHIMESSRKWTLPIRNRKSVLNRFCIEFGDRISACLRKISTQIVAGVMDTLTNPLVLEFRVARSFFKEVPVRQFQVFLALLGYLAETSFQPLKFPLPFRQQIG